MSRSPLLAPGPIPPPFQDAEVPAFAVTKVVQAAGEVILDYALESGGAPVTVRDKVLHETLPDVVEVSVGGWYGTLGQWSLLERYVGQIRLEGVTKCRQVFPDGESIDFLIEENFWHTRKRVTLESPQVGLWQIKCKRVVPLPFSTLVFDRSRQVWVAKEPFLTAMGIKP